MMKVIGIQIFLIVQTQLINELRWYVRWMRHNGMNIEIIASMFIVVSLLTFLTLSDEWNLCRCCRCTISSNSYTSGDHWIYMLEYCTKISQQVMTFSCDSRTRVGGRFVMISMFHRLIRCPIQFFDWNPVGMFDFLRQYSTTDESIDD